MMDWAEWHRGYDDPASSISARLACVRSQLSEALDRARPGPVRLVSLCAGQGRDVIGVLPGHPRRDDVRAVLVEFDGRLAETARELAARAGLDQVEVREADASVVGNYADLLPADVLLLCGIFGNVSDADVERTVRTSELLCAPGATVIWTRHRRAPDLTPSIRTWFAESRFDEVAFEALDSTAPDSTAPDSAALGSVGVNRRRDGGGDRVGADPAALPTGPLFAFRHG
jgi:hypothetical protein